MFWLLLLACIKDDDGPTDSGTSDSVPVDTQDTSLDDSGVDDTGPDTGDTGDTGPTGSSDCEPLPLVSKTWYLDADDDGFGTGEGVTSSTEMKGYADRSGDCDDTDAEIRPSAIDWHLDGIDQDCDGVDTCEGATRVPEGEPLDCALGLLVAEGFVTEPPSGGCLCAVEGSVAYYGTTPITDWDALEIVTGYFNGSDTLIPPKLVYAGRLSIFEESSPQDWSKLKGADYLEVEGQTSLVDLSSLSEVGDLLINQRITVSDLDLPALEKVDTMYLMNMTYAKVVSMPRLREAGTVISIRMDALERFELPATADIASFTIQADAMKSFTLPDGIGQTRILSTDLECLYTAESVENLLCELRREGHAPQLGLRGAAQHLVGPCLRTRADPGDPLGGHRG